MNELITEMLFILLFIFPVASKFSILSPKPHIIEEPQFVANHFTWPY